MVRRGDDEQPGGFAGNADVVGSAAPPDGQDVGVDGGVAGPAGDGRTLAARNQREHRPPPAGRRGSARVGGQRLRPPAALPGSTAVGR